MRSVVGVAMAMAFLWSGLASAAPGGSLSLGDAYRMALAQSEQVQEAVANEHIAEATYTDALTVMGPSISASASATYQNAAQGTNVQSAPQVGLQPPYNAQFILSVKQPLFRRYVFDMRRAGRYGINSADAAIVRVRQQLMMDVTTAFINVMQARAQLTIADGAVKRAELQLQSAVTRVKAGGDRPTAQLLAQIDLNRAQTELNTADGQTKLLESQLQRLIGVPPPENLTLPPRPRTDSIADALDQSRKRDDLRSLHYATLQALANVSQLQGRILWPTLDLGLGAGVILTANSGYHPGMNARDFRFPTAGIVGTFTVPLFQGGDEILQVRMQRYRASLAAAQEAFVWRQAQDDVREANGRFENAQHGIDIANEQQKAARENYRLIAVHYKLGVVTLLDVVTAQAAVFEAETNRVVADYASELATYQLLFAEGKIQL